MGLNKQKGNMYDFVTHTWNVFKGKCEFDCSYCYMKRFPQKELRFDESELKTDLGSGNTIFVGSSCDMFAPSVSQKEILMVFLNNENSQQKVIHGLVHSFKESESFAESKEKLQNNG